MLSTYTNSCALVNCKYRVLPKCPVRYHGMALYAVYFSWSTLYFLRRQNNRSAVWTGSDVVDPVQAAPMYRPVACTKHQCLVTDTCSARELLARVKIDGCYGILNVDLTCSCCCDFEFNCLVLQRSGVWDKLHCK